MGSMFIDREDAIADLEETVMIHGYPKRIYDITGEVVGEDGDLDEYS